MNNLTPKQIAKYDHMDVILASYGTDNYSGGAFVLFRNKNDGKLYENHGSHCSCYGLEHFTRQKERSDNPDGESGVLHSTSHSS